MLHVDSLDAVGIVAVLYLGNTLPEVLCLSWTMF